MSPLVSVCIPAYNAAPFIEQAVKSVLAQDLVEFELIVLENRSTDETAAILAQQEDPRIRIISQEHHVTAAENWNRALNEATGRYVKLLCADDLLHPHVLDRQVHAFEEAPGRTALVASPRDIIDGDGRILLRARGGKGFPDTLDGGEAIRRIIRSGTNALGEPVSVLMRRDLIERTQGFRTDLPYVIDLDYWCRMLSHGELRTVRSTAGAFRVQPGSWSHQLTRTQGRQMVQLFEEVAARTPAVRRRDLRLGVVRAHILARARALSYRAILLGVFGR